MPPPQELILSACSSEASSSSTIGRATSTPAVLLNDLLTSAHVHAFKTSLSAVHSLGCVTTQTGQGGAIFAVQEGKAIVNVFAWQKDQMHLKLHLPEKLSCFSVSPNGCWAAGGSPSGQIYLWELSSGLLHASFTAHYRATTSLTFSTDSHLLLSASLDSSVHVYLVSRLVDEDDSGAIGKPYGTLGDHTLAIRAVTLGKTAGSSGGRCWTASDDGTIKMWSLQPPFELLTTFSLPPTVIPSTISVDPTERYVYVGTTQGEVFYIPLFRRRAALGASAGDIEAVGGGGLGAAPIKAEGSVITVKSPITTMTLSLSCTHLLIGTHAGDIHTYSLPSHQHLRTIASHSGPVTHSSTLLTPPDLVGTAGKSEHWPIMDIKPLERMRVGRAARDVQEVSMVLQPRARGFGLDHLRLPVARVLLGSGGRSAEEANMADLLEENKKLRTGLDRAIKINESMWSGIVDLQLAQPQINGHSAKG